MEEKKLASQTVDIGFNSGGKPLAESAFLAALAKKATDGIKLRKSLIFALKDFAPYVGNFAFNEQCRIESTNLPPSDMVFLTLVSVSGYSYAGRFEKVAWSVAFSYKSIPFAFSLQKFGLKLYHHKDTSPGPSIAEEMLRALAKAMGIVGKLMEPVVFAQIATGNVTMANSFPELNNMYVYFRDEAKKSFESKPGPANLDIKDLGMHLTLAYQKKAAGSYNSSAMIDAYFSRLEHLLIILLPFVNYDRRKHDLVRLMGAIWSEKFKAIFDLDTDATAKKFYDQLVLLRERYRNPVSHGNFQKDGKSLFFHFPMGAISCQLSSSNADRSHSILKLDHAAYGEVCALFDEVDKFLETGLTKYGYRYVKSGLDVAFDEKTIRKYRAAASDDESFEEFLEYESYIDATNTNMDW